MALTVVPDTTTMPLGRPVGAPASLVETVNDPTSLTVPPATTTYTEPGVTMRSFTVTFDNSYATGGLALSAATLGFTSILDVVCTPATKNDQSDAYLTEYDLANHKLIAYKDTASSAALTQVSNTADLHLYTCHLLVIGHP